MPAIQKGNGIFLPAQAAQQLLLSGAAIPDEAEIAAHQQRILPRKPAQRRRRKPGRVAVHIPGDINHGGKPLFF